MLFKYDLWSLWWYFWRVNRLSIRCLYLFWWSKPLFFQGFRVVKVWQVPCYRTEYESFSVCPFASSWTPPPPPPPTCPLNITAGMGRFAAWRVYLLPVQQLSNESLRWWIFKSLYGRRWTLQKKDWIKVRSLVQQGTSIHILIYYIQCQWIQTL